MFASFPGKARWTYALEIMKMVQRNAMSPIFAGSLGTGSLQK